MHFLHVWALFWNPHSFLFLKTKSLKSFSFIFLLSYLSFLAFDVVSCSRGKPLSLSLSLSLSFSLSFPPIFLVFLFFATKKINGEREYVKSAYFPAPSSCKRFMRCMGASARFSAPLSRARSPVNARAWRGREGGDVSLSRAKLVLCLGSQILNFHSRAFLKNFFLSCMKYLNFFHPFLHYHSKSRERFFPKSMY